MNSLYSLNHKLPQLKLCLVREGAPSALPLVIKGPDDVADMLAPLVHASEEYFVALHLNARQEVIGLHEVSHGTLSSSLVHPREVFKAALLANSHSILVCHNHPSGSALSPSTDDFDTTKQLLKAGNFLGIAVVDHLIVGPGGSAYSMREKHAELWNPPVL